MDDLILYHMGFQIIEKPDVHYGRKNADFGQGFYLSAQKEFSMRWARERKGAVTYLNRYSLNLEGLNIKRFERNEEWFRYLFANRRGYSDGLGEFDVIIGPIANDTLYDTWGIITSGFLEESEAMELLMLGAVYEQVVLKNEKAAAALRFLGAREVSGDEIAGYRERVRMEEEAYQREFAAVLDKMSKE